MIKMSHKYINNYTWWTASAEARVSVLELGSRENKKPAFAIIVIIASAGEGGA